MLGLQPWQVLEKGAVWPKPEMGGLWLAEMERNGIVNKRKEKLTNLNPEPQWS